MGLERAPRSWEQTRSLDGAFIPGLILGAHPCLFFPDSGGNIKGFTPTFVTSNSSRNIVLHL